MSQEVKVTVVTANKWQHCFQLGYCENTSEMGKHWCMFDCTNWLNKKSDLFFCMNAENKREANGLMQYKESTGVQAPKCGFMVNILHWSCWIFWVNSYLKLYAVLATHQLNIQHHYFIFYVTVIFSSAYTNKQWSGLCSIDKVGDVRQYELAETNTVFLIISCSPKLLQTVSQITSKNKVFTKYVRKCDCWPHINVQGLPVLW